MPRGPETAMPSPRLLERLALVTLLSTIGILMSRFGSDGSDLVLRIVLGEDSARANMEYYNVSSSILSSLDGLWEIFNIAACCFLLCLCAAARDGFGLTRIVSGIGMFVMFIASGSRSMIIYVLVAIVLTCLMRPPVSRLTVSKRKRSRAWLINGVAALVFVAAAIAAVGSYLSRFANYDLSVGLALMSMLVNHNDMLRELGSVLGRIELYSNVGQFDFMLTPFTFLLPRFLGFDKDIPEHLVIYNMNRMGIDIRTDPGNYFPGMVADFVMVFGPWAGAIAFAAFLCAIFLVVRRIARVTANAHSATALYASSVGLTFIAFRNIPGSFALSVLIIAGLAWLTVTRNTHREPQLQMQAQKL
jgi:hypothetical protein